VFCLAGFEDQLHELTTFYSPCFSTARRRYLVGGGKESYVGDYWTVLISIYLSTWHSTLPVFKMKKCCTDQDTVTTILKNTDSVT